MKARRGKREVPAGSFFLLFLSSTGTRAESFWLRVWTFGAKKFGAFFSILNLFFFIFCQCFYILIQIKYWIFLQNDALWNWAFSRTKKICVLCSNCFTLFLIQELLCDCEFASCSWHSCSLFGSRKRLVRNFFLSWELHYSFTTSLHFHFDQTSMWISHKPLCAESAFVPCAERTEDPTHAAPKGPPRLSYARVSTATTPPWRMNHAKHQTTETNLLSLIAT